MPDPTMHDPSLHDPTPPMKVLLFGSTGTIGSAIDAELRSRGHEVTGVSRRGTVTGDVRDADTVERLAKGHDVVASAIGPRHDGADSDDDILVGGGRALVEGLRRGGTRRLVVLGGAGSLRLADGSTLLESPGFPEIYRANAVAQSAVLALLREVDDLDWTYVSPAMTIGPGPRTGIFRVGGDDLLADADGVSAISVADFAIAFADEIESGSAVRRRISVAY